MQQGQGNQFKILTKLQKFINAAWPPSGPVADEHE